jgi:TonB-dependent receptor
MIEHSTKTQFSISITSLFTLALLLINPGKIWSKNPGEKQAEDVYISINLKNATLRQALDEISKKSGLSITYNDSDLTKKADAISYEHERVSVNQILGYILKDTGLAFREFKNIIVIYKLPPPPKNQNQAKGSIEGILSDSENGEALVGANVRVLGTPLGGNADVDGHYQIPNVPSGVYQVAVSFIGYETSIIRDVKVSGGQATKVDYKLAASKTELQSIEIIGNSVLSGNVVETNELAMVNSIKASPLIITGISAQQIARSIDQDAGEVARRLPGVSILNNFVNIRGMHERYNLTVLNDMIAPSSEADRRAFSYDLLPSNMIDKMTVYRSPSPDLLADWAGGVIKVETKNTAIARQFEISLSGWAREGTTFQDRYTGASGGQDWLGKDDGTRALPAGFPGIEQIPGDAAGQVNRSQRTRNLALISPAERSENALWGQKMFGKWNLQRDKTPIDYRAGINYYDSWLLGKMRLNNLTSINTTQAYQTINQSFNPFKSYDLHGQLNQSRTYQDTISRKTARWGLLQNLRLRINPNHTIEAKAIFNQLGTDETYVRDGYNNYVIDTDMGYVTKIFYTYKSRSILAMQLSGKHALGAKKDHQLNWSGAYSTSNELVPAQRLVALQPDNNFIDDPTAPRYVRNGASQGEFSLANAFFYSESHEKNFTGFIDYEKKFGEDWSIKAGFFDEKKTRDIDSRFVNIGFDREQDLFLVTDEGAKASRWNAEDVLGSQNFKENGGGLFIYDNHLLSGQYHVDGNIAAGYLALLVPVIPKKLSLYGGMRYENQDLELTGPVEEDGVRRDVTFVKRSTPHWLPSVNLKYSFHEQLAFRAAFGRTINRPNYREMIPVFINDPKLELLQYGNEKLVDATIDNYDARLEWYPSESEFISVGVFYKKMSNAIEPYIDLVGKLEELKFTNTPRADVRGVEVEIRKSLGSIAPVRWLQYFSTIANFSVLKSEVKIQDTLFVTRPGSFEDFRPKTRQLEGTAKYVINGGLYFDHPRWGTKISLLYNILGQRLVYAGTPFFPATYELPRNVLDLTVRQQLTKHLELRAGVQDILNQPRKLYRDFDRDEKFNPDRWNKLPYKDYVFQQYKPGSYWMVGINITL